MKLTMILIVDDALGTVLEGGSGKKIGETRDQRKNRDQPNFSIVKIGQNALSPGDLRRLAIT